MIWVLDHNALSIKVNIISLIRRNGVGGALFMFTPGFEFIERFKRALLFRWILVVETITEIAEQVAVKVDVVKIKLELRVLDRQLETAYRELGQTFFHLGETSSSQPLQDDKISQLAAHIQQFLSYRSHIHDKLSEIQDKSFLDPVDEFLKRFKQVGGVILSVDISTSGGKVGQLELPASTLVIGIQRKDQVIIPRADISLHSGDRLFILAPARRLDEVQKTVREYSAGSSVRSTPSKEEGWRVVSTTFEDKL